jgi:hypothetical protein
MHVLGAPAACLDSLVAEQVERSELAVSINTARQQEKPGRVLLANYQALFGIEVLPLARLSAAHSITKLSLPS